MRPVKFRAWFTLKEIMVEHENLSMQYDRNEGFTFAFDYMSYFDEESVEGTLNFDLMQYTGLKDKNGKEIYEGDIVRKIEIGFEWKKDIDDLDSWLESGKVISHEIDEDGFITYHYPSKVDEVVMDKFPCYWLKNESFGYEGEDLVPPTDCEVIGNIYEHPHLLEVTP